MPARAMQPVPVIARRPTARPMVSALVFELVQELVCSPAAAR